MQRGFSFLCMFMFLVIFLFREDIGLDIDQIIQLMILYGVMALYFKDT